MKTLQYKCPTCGFEKIEIFYEVSDAPTNSVLLLSTREEAINFPTGKIQLGFCGHCGFIYNTAFDPKLTEYSTRYEATQGYSPTFNNFHFRLAQDLIRKYDLHKKDVIEIGCGKGDFLTILCEMGNNRGVGFDPAYEPERYPSDFANQLTFITDYYSEKYADYTAEFICCKMTLEHISDTYNFVNVVRRSIGENNSIVFFQIPNADYVLDDIAFWDVYYEHCSYFTKDSLAYLFQRADFNVLERWTDYDDQYLMIEARPHPGTSDPSFQPAGVAATLAKVKRFEEGVRQARKTWRRRIDDFIANARSVVLWGGGSKGVAFLTTLSLTLNDIQYVVDINPNKTGAFMAGTGQEIVAPDFLQSYQPDVVIIMNPIYKEEIARQVQSMDLSPQILTV